MKAKRESMKLQLFKDNPDKFILDMLNCVEPVFVLFSHVTSTLLFLDASFSFDLLGQY